MTGSTREDAAKDCRLEAHEVGPEQTYSGMSCEARTRALASQCMHGRLRLFLEYKALGSFRRDESVPPTSLMSAIPDGSGDRIRALRY